MDVFKVKSNKFSSHQVLRVFQVMNLLQSPVNVHLIENSAQQVKFEVSRSSQKPKMDVEEYCLSALFMETVAYQLTNSEPNEPDGERCPLHIGWASVLDTYGCFMHKKSGCGAKVIVAFRTSNAFRDSELQRNPGTKNVCKLCKVFFLTPILNIVVGSS